MVWKERLDGFPVLVLVLVLVSLRRGMWSRMR
jgi:hypothetical protein